MYNFFTHRKELRMNSKMKKMMNEYVDEEIERKKLNDDLSDVYRRRIEGFVMSMIDKPIPIQEFKEAEYKPRPEDTKKFVGGTTMYFQGFRRERERIEHEIEKNKVLDDVPNTNIAKHKFRDYGKSEVALHYKPQTTIERLEVELSKTRHNQLDNYTEAIHKKQSQEKIQPLKRISSRNIFPTLHQKTHFKSLVTIFNEYDRGCLNSKAKNSYYSTNDDQQNHEDMMENSQASRISCRRNKKNQGSQNFNPRETSKEAMLKCNLINVDDSIGPRMKKGQGKWIYSDDVTFKKLYSSLYDGKVKLKFMR